MSSTIFTQQFLEHVSSYLSVDTHDLKEAIDNYLVETEEVEEVKKKPAPKAKPKASPKSKVGHTCERIPRGPNKDVCGKPAKNSVDEGDGKLHWYCGTEKSGCYKCILGQMSRQTKSTPPKATPKAKKAPGKKPTTLEGKKKLADENTKELIKKTIKRQKLTLKKRSVGGKSVYMDNQTRVLVDRATQEAYGKLAKDNETIKSLEDEDIRWLEASGISVRQKEESSESEEESEEEEIELEEDEEISLEESEEDEEIDLEESEESSLLIESSDEE